MANYNTDPWYGKSPWLAPISEAESRVNPITPMETLLRAGVIGRAAGLRYVYEGNVPGEKGENTYCYHCGALLIDRYGFYVRSNNIQEGCCPECGVSIDGISMSMDRKG